MDGKYHTSTETACPLDGHGVKKVTNSRFTRRFDPHVEVETDRQKIDGELTHSLVNFTLNSQDGFT